MFLYKEKLRVHLECQFEYTRFPFDEQACDFKVGDYMQDKDHMILRPPEITYRRKFTNLTSSPLAIQLRHLPFDVIELESLEPFVHFETGYDYSYTGMRIYMRDRSIGPLFSSFFVPTAFFSLLSLISYTINPDIVSFIRR